VRNLVMPRLAPRGSISTARARVRSSSSSSTTAAARRRRSAVFGSDPT